MKVLIADGMEKEGLEVLAREGIAVKNRKMTSEELMNMIPSFDGLIVRSATNVTKEVIDAGENLKIIGRAGVGVDNIDVAAATEKGIVVKFAPYGNTNSTAEHALGLMLAVSRHIPQAFGSLKSGMWVKKQYMGTELANKTLGIIGCGRVGKRLAELVMGFNMQVLGYDPYCQSTESRIKHVKLEELLANSDYVSLHLSGQEKPIITSKEILQMKKTAYLINASRGANLDEEALHGALNLNAISGAALDVYEEEGKEGKPYLNKLFELPNFIGTPHLGASTAEAQKKTSTEMAEVVANFLTKGDWTNSYNFGQEVELKEAKTHLLYVHHQDKPGMFAKIDAVLADQGVNIREITARKDKNALAVYRVQQEVDEETITRIKAIEGVYSVKK